MAADMDGRGSWTAQATSRVGRSEALGAGEQLSRLLRVGRNGLPLALDARTGLFAQTVRRVEGLPGLARREGTSLRYTAIAALGLSRLEPEDQREALRGRDVVELAHRTATLALEQPDPGAVALAVWAVAETGGTVDPALLARLGRELAAGGPVATVDLSWILTAALAAGPRGEALARRACSVLMAAQGAQGIFPHVVPARTQNRWRRHVGSFADQVYPLQALARTFAVTGEAAVLDAAEATARRICELQGPAGQWWWHYDARTGDVVERFPVYSVHQHAMAPMVLFDLAEAGGTDRTSHVVKGLTWMSTHPEVDGTLVADSLGTIWRKAGRREPRKATRTVSAVTTSVRPGLHLPFLDRVFPVTRIDRECRPYELGWLLYAWLPTREVSP